MVAKSGYIYSDIPEHLASEEFRDVLCSPHLRIERIVSRGQATPAGQWLEQDCSEWVMVLKGSAALRFDGEDAPRVLEPGDYLAIPAHCRHRVEWTASGEPTIWLAVHYREA